MPSLVMIETSSASDTKTATPEEYRVWVGQLSAERGTDAATAAVDESGRLLTPQGFSDTCFDVSGTGRVVACRRVTGSAFVATPNIDYIVGHWPLAKYSDPDQYGGLEDGSAHWLYAGKWANEGIPRAQPTSPVWDAALARISPDDGFLLFVEFLAQPEVYLWREDLRTRERQVIAALPQAVTLGDIAFIGDGAWAVVGGGAHMYLVNTRTGHFTKLPERFRAACWDPGSGPSALLAAQQDGDGSTIGSYSLSTGEWRAIANVPGRVLGLDVGGDGEVAAVLTGTPTATVPTVVVLNLVSGSVEACRPPRFGTGAARVTQRPRWVSRPAPAEGPLVLSDGWVAALRQSPVTRTDAWVDKMGQEWVDRIRRRVRAVSEDPTRANLLVQIQAMSFEVAQLDPAFRTVVRQNISPILREIARRPIAEELQAFYLRIADDLDDDMS